MTNYNEDQQEEQRANSDKVTHSSNTKYDDRLSKFEKRVIEGNPEFSHLKPRPRRWEYPRGVRFTHSKVNDEHKAAQQRRRNERRG